MDRHVIMTAGQQTRIPWLYFYLLHWLKYWRWTWTRWHWFGMASLKGWNLGDLELTRRLYDWIGRKMLLRTIWWWSSFLHESLGVTQIGGNGRIRRTIRQMLNVSPWHGDSTVVYHGSCWNRDRFLSYGGNDVGFDLLDVGKVELRV
jgi:hypothetical protein